MKLKVLVFLALFTSTMFASSLEYKVHRAGADGFNLASVLV